MLKLAEASIEWALKHIDRYGDTNIFPRPVEFAYLTQDRPKLIGVLKNIDLENWGVGEHRNFFVPKSAGGFRFSTQLDLLDSILFSALIYEVGSDLERHRIPKAASIVFSWRFDPDPEGNLFKESKVDWDAFVNRSRRIAEDHKYVLVTDIADFYPRIYHHPLENALEKCVTSKPHLNAVKRLLTKVNYRTSYGIPVGIAGSGLLAELALHDIDSVLTAEGVDYCRFVDDFRIGADTPAEARNRAELLSKLLYQRLGLTLSSAKTEVLSSEEFVEKYLVPHELRERVQLDDLVSTLLDDAQSWMEYPQAVTFESLSATSQDALQHLNLYGLLEAELEKEDIDFKWAKFLIRRLSLLGNKEACKLLLESLERLFPILEVVPQFFMAIQGLSMEEKIEHGKKVIEELEAGETITHEFHKAYFISVFASGKLLASPHDLLRLHGKVKDESLRRELILALGEIGFSSWFSTYKKDFHAMPTWERRAFLVGARCMSKDERGHWVGAIKSRFDNTEAIIADAVLSDGHQHVALPAAMMYPPRPAGPRPPDDDTPF